MTDHKLPDHGFGLGNRPSILSVLELRSNSFFGVRRTSSRSTQFGFRRTGSPPVRVSLNPKNKAERSDWAVSMKTSNVAGHSVAGVTDRGAFGDKLQKRRKRFTASFQFDFTVAENRQEFRAGVSEPRKS